jgi:hypothetical protein
LTWQTTSGGKSRGASPPRPLFEAGEAFLEEALAPFAHDLAGQAEAFSNFLVFHSFGRQEDDFRTHDISIR